MFRSALLFLLLATPPCAGEQHKVASVPRFNRKAFIAEVSLLAGSKTADAVTTRQLADRGGWEGDPFFERHPSPGKQAGINLGIFGTQAGFLYVTEHSRHP